MKIKIQRQLIQSIWNKVDVNDLSGKGGEGRGGEGGYIPRNRQAFKGASSTFTLSNTTIISSTKIIISVPSHRAARLINFKYSSISFAKDHLVCKLIVSTKYFKKDYVVTKNL